MKKREKIYIFDTKILTGGLFHGKNEFDLVFENMIFLKEENLSMIRLKWNIVS